MGKTKIKKEDIIKAIKTESLEAGCWIDVDFSNCKVCAVGAIVKQTLEKNNLLSVRRVDSICELNTENECIDADEYQTSDSLKDKQWLTAISGYFEREWRRSVDRNSGAYLSRHQKYRVKQKTIKFVEKNIPKSFFIQIPDFESSAESV